MRTFHIAGVQFHEYREALKDLDLKVGTEVDLVPEPENKFDPNAVRIEFKGMHLGYVPKKLSAEISAFIDCSNAVAVLEEVNPSAKPWEMFKVTIRGRLVE